MTAIQLDGVVCALGDKLTLELDRLRITHGERIAIIGPNGAGKSSLLRVLSGFVRPERGTVTVLGRRLDQGEPIRACISSNAFPSSTTC